VSAKISAKDLASIVGLVTTLGSITSANPSLIIKSLTDVLWNKDEELQLLKAAKAQDSLFDAILEDGLKESQERVKRQLGMS